MAHQGNFGPSKTGQPEREKRVSRLVPFFPGPGLPGADGNLPLQPARGVVNLPSVTGFPSPGFHRVSLSLISVSQAWGSLHTVPEMDQFTGR